MQVKLSFFIILSKRLLSDDILPFFKLFVCWYANIILNLFPLFDLIVKRNARLFMRHISPLFCLQITSLRLIQRPVRVSSALSIAVSLASSFASVQYFYLCNFSHPMASIVLPDAGLSEHQPQFVCYQCLHRRHFPFPCILQI